MALILNIDCAVENASVFLCDNHKVLAFEKSNQQKNHSSFLQPAIKKIMNDANKNLQEIDAIAVTIGPGSYTGLRVGLSSAKGLCYALNKPLIAANTLEIMALAAISNFSGEFIYCPMIDARRMEVFTALYDASLNTLLAPVAMILDENSFCNELKQRKVIFFGNGSLKFNAIINNSNAVFGSVEYDANALNLFSQIKFIGKQFADIAYMNPFYLKEFYSPLKNYK